MPSGREKINEFPEDDAFWFIKWIDEFKIPHLGTRSSSVSVILQKLPFNKISDLQELSSEGLLQILGQRTNKDENIVVSRPNPVVMPGTLPLLYIGSIYQNKIQVGELPTWRVRLDLHNGGQEGTEVTLGEVIPPPQRWMEKIPRENRAPYYILNKYEYSMVSLKMKPSRCLVINRHNITYVIPRTTIFKTFYACHTELAKSFCNGPWPKRLHDVICMIDLKSGLKTEKTSSGHWNVIIQTLVPDSFAELLALYYFDPFARACAESIYSKSLQDRNGRIQEPWYASAQIPFMPTKQKLSLDVRGFYLRSWKYRDEDGREIKQEKFLVTEIVGSTWPEYLPEIGYERANSGQKGITQTKIDAPKPFQKPKEEQSSSSESEIDGAHDADANSPVRHMSATEFGWINQPKKRKIEKNSSTQYTGADGAPPSSKSNDKVSTGEHTHQKDTIGLGEAEIKIREPEKRFEHIIDVLESLSQKNCFTSVQIVPCPFPGRQIRRGNHDCWSFIDEESLTYNYRPRKGWRLAEYDSENPRKSKYRSALIMKIEIEKKLHYWIEIECREKESGFRSALLSKISGNASQTILAALEIIAQNKGTNMKAPLNQDLANQGVIADCYKHIYESKDSSKLNIDSVKRFLVGR
jgi:hypothetical protein